VAGRAVADGAVMIDLAEMKGTSVDAPARTVRAEGGLNWGELNDATAEHGLAVTGGAISTTGIAGLTLGGGLGWLMAKHGLAADNVLAFELVDADGEVLDVTEASDPDLFWALRGGGGGYAIVTALHIELLPIAEIYAGALLFPAAVGAEAIRTYRDWAAEAADEVTSVVRFLTPPPLPDVPEPLRGTPLLTISGACIGTQEEGEAAFAPLRAELGETIMDTFEWMPTAGLSRIHMDPENPVPGIGEGGLVKELTDEAIDAFVSIAGPDSGTPLLLSELRCFGGAIGRPAADAGALSHIDADYAIYSVGMAMTPEMAEGIRAHLAKIDETMRPFAADGRYFNFTEAPCDVDAILPPDVCDRLAEVKRKWDPDGRVVANHTVSLGEV
jgi:FAD/FMN-containing dehydrogenase